ncbi:MFS transporter [Nocardioides sp.]|uniref:MFS transporter n=1 Tax=Nocardioides sp. TaxID=35761 RepID=UPI003518FA43
MGGEQRSFWSQLPREGRLLLSIVAVEFIGTGLVLPFAVVYLHEVRGFALSDVGLLLALSPLAGVLVTAPAGWLIDVVGPRRVTMSVAATLVVSNVVLAYADTLALAAVAVALQGAAFGASFPSFQSLIAGLVPPQLRTRYFGVNFMLLNLGIGIGGIVGGFVVDVDDVRTFQAIYLADALSYVPVLLVLLIPLRHIGRPLPRHHDDAGRAASAQGYLAVLRAPAVAPLMVLTMVGSFVGYSQLNTGMPAFARALGEVSTRGLGFAFAANTLVIVVLQLLVLRRIDGLRRTRVIAVMAVVWSGSWLLLGAAALVPGTVAATLFVAGCASVFALGETMLQPTIPALVNDLAPDHLRGRYNAVSSAAFSLPGVVAPATAGFLIDHDLGAVYIGVLVVGALLIAVLAVGLVEPRLPAGTNRTTLPGAAADDAEDAGGPAAIDQLGGATATVTDPLRS